jgi:hypothetical protein
MWQRRQKAERAIARAGGAAAKPKGKAAAARESKEAKDGKEAKEGEGKDAAAAPAAAAAAAPAKKKVTLKFEQYQSVSNVLVARLREGEAKGHPGMTQGALMAYYVDTFRGQNDSPVPR